MLTLYGSIVISGKYGNVYEEEAGMSLLGNGYTSTRKAMELRRKYRMFRCCMHLHYTQGNLLFLALALSAYIECGLAIKQKSDAKFLRGSLFYVLECLSPFLLANMEANYSAFMIQSGIIIFTHFAGLIMVCVGTGTGNQYLASTGGVFLAPVLALGIFVAGIAILDYCIKHNCPTPAYRGELAEEARLREEVRRTRELAQRIGESREMAHYKPYPGGQHFASLQEYIEASDKRSTGEHAHSGDAKPDEERGPYCDL